MEKLKNDLQSRIGILVCYNSVLIIMASFGIFYTITFRKSMRNRR